MNLHKKTLGALGALFVLLFGLLGMSGIAADTVQSNHGCNDRCGCCYDSCSGSSSASLLKKIQGKVSCQYVIKASDINPNGFVINKPGNWCLAEDVTYCPESNLPAITIVTSNVTLDLNTKTLSLRFNRTCPNSCSNPSVPIDGIDVLSGLTNITIANGTVRDFSRAGIAFVPPLNPGDVTTVVDVTNIRAINNGRSDSCVDYGSGGIVLFSTVDTLIENCELVGNSGAAIMGFDLTKLTVDNCHCDDSQAAMLTTNQGPRTFASGLTLVSLEDGNHNILLKNSTFNRATSSSMAYGIDINPQRYQNYSSEIVIENCQMDDTLVDFCTPEYEEALSYGAYFFFCNNISVRNSQFLRSTVTAWSDNQVLESIGLSCILGSNLQVDNCQFANANIVSYGYSEYYTQATGLDIEGVSDFCVTNSVFDGMSSQVMEFYPETESDTTGIEIFDSSQGSMKNCQFMSNTCSAPEGTLMITAGVFMEGNCKSILFEDCFAANNQQGATNPVGYSSIAAGFIAASCNQVTFKRCVSANNQDSLSGNAAGFSTTDPYGNYYDYIPNYPNDQYVFDSCVAEGNLGNSAAAGFDIHNVIGSKIINCLADRNSIGILVTEDTSGLSGNNIFENNVLLGNLEAGILDETSVLSNAYLTNRAESNGPWPSHTNYSGTIFPHATCSDHHDCHSANGTPIRYWKLPKAPCDHNTNCEEPSLLDNLSIER